MVELKSSVYDVDAFEMAPRGVAGVAPTTASMAATSTTRATTTTTPVVVTDASYYDPLSRPPPYDDMFPDEQQHQYLPQQQPVRVVSSSSSPSLPTEAEYEEYLRSRRLSAGVASGVFGLLLGGPILAAILGFGAAYAVEQEGATGDVVRAVGDIALQARDRAMEIDQKHHVVDITKAKATEVWEKAQKIDREHHLLERSKDCLVRAFETTSDFVQRHHIIERLVACVGKTLHWLIQKIVMKIEGDQGPPQQGYPQPHGHQRVPTEEPRVSTPPAYRASTY